MTISFKKEDFIPGLIILGFITVILLVFMAIPTNHCPYCGNETENEYDLYCSRCGHKLDTMWKYNTFNQPKVFLKDE